MYSSDVEIQDAYIEACKARSYDVLKIDVMIDNHFMQHLEQKESDVQFKRVDADTIDNLIENDEKIESVLSEKEQETLKTAYMEAVNDPTIVIELKALSPNDMPVMITQSEWMRRMKEMQSMSGGMNFMGNMPDQVNIVVNTNHALASKVLKSKAKKQEKIQQLIDIALLSQGLLKGKKMTEFINRSFEVMGE